MKPVKVGGGQTDIENWKAPLQERFERSIPGCRVFAIMDDVYISGTYGVFSIGRRFGGNMVSISMKQSPYDVSRMEGALRKRIENNGFKMITRRAE